MAGYTSELNPSVVKTELDDVFFPEYSTVVEGPGMVSVKNGDVFKQTTTDRAAVIQEILKGTGYWKQRAEQENVEAANARVANKLTKYVLNYAKKLPIPKRMFDDDQHGTVNDLVADMARKGGLTQEKNGFAIYRNAFSSVTTADGNNLISDSHTNINGDTIDNKLTAGLSVSALDTAYQTAIEQKAQDGTQGGFIPVALLVPPALYPTAVKITESELEPNTADNQINVYSSKYGLKVYQTPFIGAAADGSDSAWFLLGRNHSVYRWERQPIETTMVDWKYTDNNVYVYKGEYREVTGPITYEGIIGSTGSA